MRLKKEFLLVFFIISFIIILELITNHFSKESVDKIYKEITSVNSNLEENNLKKENNTLEKSEIKALEEKIKKLKKDWLIEQNKLSAFFEHDELEKVTKCIIVLEENAKNEEYTDALEDGKEFIYWLNHFKEKDTMELKNIF